MFSINTLLGKYDKEDQKLFDLLNEINNCIDFAIELGRCETNITIDKKLTENILNRVINNLENKYNVKYFPEKRNSKGDIIQSQYITVKWEGDSKK